MAEVLARFADPIAADDGTRYLAQVCGAAMADGLWEGWIEFIPTGGGEPIRSPRETTQPSRGDTAYWASGLTRVYLEGAFDRARRPLVRREEAPTTAVFDGPAPSHVRIPADAGVEPEAVLDPFSVYEKGEAVLRKELRALSAWHLVNIVRAYELGDADESLLNRTSPGGLIDLIVEGVKTARATRR